MSRIANILREGRHTFMGIELLVAPGALVPREETELLGYTAVEALARIAEPRVIDMCTGSGNLACGIAIKVPNAHVWCSDLTIETVSVARANMEKFGLSSRVTVKQGDLFEALVGLEGTIDLVVCNPPYISSGKLEKESNALLAHEPREAFDGGPYGLSIQQRVAIDAAKFLKPDGLLMFEFGLGQERQLNAVLTRAKAYTDVQFVNNIDGKPRVAIAKRKHE